MTRLTRLRHTREEAISKGEAWIDRAGTLHPGWPDQDRVAEAIAQSVSAPQVQAALARANEASWEVGRLLRELDEAERRSAAAFREFLVCAVAEWSRTNAAPHEAASAAEASARALNHFESGSLRAARATQEAKKLAELAKKAAEV